jgi:5'/3'-nucleotidase SurE
MDFDGAIAAVWPVCQNFLQNDDLVGKVLNINVPAEALEGTPQFAVVPVNTNNMGYHFMEGLDPKGRPWMWQTIDPPPSPLNHECDVYLCQQGIITFSPLSIDLTCHATLKNMRQRLGGSMVEPENNHRPAPNSAAFAAPKQPAD